MRYVDGFVIPIAKKNIAAYRKMAREAGKMWMKRGALEYMECVGEDLHPKGDPNFSILLFPKMAKAKKGETVLFSFIVYRSRKHRDSVDAKVMKDMEKKYAKKKDMPMPFEMKRMAYGGFAALVDL